jgi:hypothetical protein
VPRKSGKVVHFYLHWTEERVMNSARRNLMASEDSFHELQEEDLDNISAGQRQLNIAVVVRSSDQHIVQTGNQLDVVVNNRVRAYHLPIG